MNKLMRKLLTKINEQDQFMRASYYIMGGFLIILVGYGVGRLVGLILF
ncbi:hypothetical protein ACQKL5_07695 [Peribacillus sp. NPDC097675]